MNHVFAFILAGMTGILVAFEPTVNSGLGKYITPRLATLHSFIVGTAAVVIINIVSGGFKDYKFISQAPPYF